MRSIQTRQTQAGTTYFVRFRHRGKQTSEKFPTEAEAKRFVKEMAALGVDEAVERLYERDGANPSAAEVPTLDEVAAEHIASLTHAEPGTRDKYTRMWERTYGPLVGSTPIDQVSLDDLRQAAGALGERYSHKSLENQRGLLVAVLDRAVYEKHIPANPAKRRLRLPAGQPSRGKDDMRILSVDEFLSIEEKIPEHYRPFVRFLWGTGARWGEAVALTVEHVRLPNVMIRQAVKYAPGEYRVGAPKTRKGRRTISVPTELHDELTRLCEGKAKADLVFTAHRGGPILHRTFWSRYWLPAVADLEPRPRIHDLRHSHASWLLGRGVPIHVVQARLGHESIKTTVDTYSHLLPDAQRMAADAAALAFAPLPELD